MMRASIYVMGAFFVGIAPTAVPCKSTEMHARVKNMFNVHKRNEKIYAKFPKWKKL
jgi:hypothetical protein